MYQSISSLCDQNVQGLKEQVDSKLSMVQEIRFEPRLLSEGDDRLKHGSQIGQLHLHHTFDLYKSLSLFLLSFILCLFLGCYNYLYRMKALDAIRDAGN